MKPRTLETSCKIYFTFEIDIGEEFSDEGILWGGSERGSDREVDIAELDSFILCIRTRILTELNWFEFTRKFKSLVIIEKMTKKNSGMLIFCT